MATINGKNIVSSGTYLFLETDTVTVDGFPLTIKADPAAPAAVSVKADNGAFTLSLDGLTSQAFDRVSVGNGIYLGQPIHFLAHGSRVAETQPPLYEVTYTVYLA